MKIIFIQILVFVIVCLYYCDNKQANVSPVVTDDLKNKTFLIEKDTIKNDNIEILEIINKNNFYF